MKYTLIAALLVSAISSTYAATLLIPEDTQAVQPLAPPPPAHLDTMQFDVGQDAAPPAPVVQQINPEDLSPAVRYFDPIYFDTGKADLKPEAMSTILSNIKWLQQNKNTYVAIEGHADVRGSDEYNTNLGEKRAISIENYYLQNGIDSSRLRAISFGRLKPVCEEQTEACWAKNRRVEESARVLLSYQSWRLWGDEEITHF